MRRMNKCKMRSRFVPGDHKCKFMSFEEYIEQVKRDYWPAYDDDMMIARKYMMHAKKRYNL